MNQTTNDIVNYVQYDHVRKYQILKLKLSGYPLADDNMAEFINEIIGWDYLRCGIKPPNVQSDQEEVSIFVGSSTATCIIIIACISLLSSGVVPDDVSPAIWVIMILCALICIPTSLALVSKVIDDARSRQKRFVDKEEVRDIIRARLIDVDWLQINTNRKLVHILELLPEKISWKILSANPSAIFLIEQNLDKVYWKQLSSNPAAIHILEQNIDKIDSVEISKNHMAIDLLKKHPQLINWMYIGANAGAIELIEQNRRQTYDFMICTNPAAIHLIRQKGFRVSWEYLSENPAAIDILRENESKICWRALSKNPAAIDLLIANPTKIDWFYVNYNPNAYQLMNAFPNDFNLYKTVFGTLKELWYPINQTRQPAWELLELLNQDLYHPRRISAWLEKGHNLEWYMQYT